MRTRTVGCVFVLAALAAACESAAAPCPDDRCTTALPDLGMVSVEVVSGARDAQTGLAVVQPAAIDVRVVVRNHGEGTSDEKPLFLELGVTRTLLLPLPRLAKGASYEHTVRIEAPAAGTFLIDTDTLRLTASIVTLDANAANNVLKSEPFHLALPALRVRASIDSAVLRANAGTASSIMIDNVSRHATLAPATFAYCIYELGGRCIESFRATAFGRTLLPSIGPGESLRLDYAVNVPSNAANQSRAESYFLGACMAAGVVAENVLPSTATCVDVKQVEIRPDFEACNPVRLEADRVVAGSIVCNNPCDVYAFSVRTEVGTTYLVETATGEEEGTLRWRTRYRDNPVDASPAPGFQPAVAGTYYLVTAPKYCGSPGPGQVVLRVVPQ
jgi:hypothetical protein